jgi:hypothetical protein
MRVESTWTPPRPDCDTFLWHAPDGMATESEVSDLIAALVRSLRAKTVLETGTYLGHTARKIADALAEHDGFLWTLEQDQSSYRLAVNVLHGLPAEVLLVDSLEWEPEATFDLVFFDSDIETREAEMRKYREFAAPHCLWALHDSRDERLQLALKRLESEGLINSPLQLNTPRGIAIGRFR